MKKIVVSLIVFSVMADPTKMLEVEHAAKSKEIFVIITTQPAASPVNNHGACCNSRQACCCALGCCVALGGAGCGTACSGLGLMATTKSTLATYVGSRMVLWGSLAGLVGTCSAKALASELGDEMYQSC